MSADAPTFDQALREQILRNKPRIPLSLQEIVQHVMPPHVPFDITEIGLMHHRITVPAEYLDAVREAVERGRVLGHLVEYAAFKPVHYITTTIIAERPAS